MIIWRGWGILVVLIAGLFAVPSGLTAESFLGPELAPLGVALGLAAAGIAVFFVGQRLNAPRPGFHPGTGQPVMYRNAHTLFFVPMQFWGFILLGVSVLVGVMTLIGA
ncbi:hypothetical protein CLV63_11822 [Murinocardiopsis flavida]|uniref:Uncharacterized protein n=1 Tax=Murinocardiopsis flavida TaxID=645275 RepID=A0A2P8D4X4_9ACTN|nr:hypothetical protein [Murinocardiopsis flavida]PSK92265.1 hypothetical protein CLV63_11822 [Murinocardiopsis flavida]